MEDANKRLKPNPVPAANGQPSTTNTIANGSGGSGSGSGAFPNLVITPAAGAAGTWIARSGQIGGWQPTD